MKNIFFIRPTEPNRGDIISRYGLLKLASLNQNKGQIIILSNRNADEIPCSAKFVRPGPLKDLFPGFKQLRSYSRGDIVCWAVGHDLQDDSSLLKLPFLAVKFFIFRLFGMKIRIISQGAGPINTIWGRFFIKVIMALLESASFRDTESTNLITALAPKYKNKYSTVVDSALFATDAHKEKAKSKEGALVLGLNLRRWFHFDGHWMPYEYRVRLGLVKEVPGERKMESVMDNMAVFLDKIVQSYDIKIRMIPMYPPGIEEWEDDLKLLQHTMERMKCFKSVEISEKDMKPQQLIEYFSELDLMIGMRLHSTIIATSMGIPSIHLAYSPKGYSYFRTIGEEEYCYPVERLAEIEEPEELLALFDKLKTNRLAISERLLAKTEKLRGTYREQITGSIL